MFVEPWRRAGWRGAAGWSERWWRTAERRGEPASSPESSHLVERRRNRQITHFIFTYEPHISRLETKTWSKYLTIIKTQLLVKLLNLQMLDNSLFITSSKQNNSISAFKHLHVLFWSYYSPYWSHACSLQMLKSINSYEIPFFLCIWTWISDVTIYFSGLWRQEAAMTPYIIISGILIVGKTEHT